MNIDEVVAILKAGTRARHKKKCQVSKRRVSPEIWDRMLLAAQRLVLLTLKVATVEERDSQLREAKKLKKRSRCWAASTAVAHAGAATAAFSRG
jgi:hypothetical protein